MQHLQKNTLLRTFSITLNAYFFVLICLTSISYASPPLADSVHFCLPFDYAQWQRDHPRAASRDPLSSIQSLGDLGYIVDVSQADAYTLPSPTAAKLAIASEHQVPINCIIIEPIGEIDEYKPIELKPKRVKVREDQ